MDTQQNTALTRALAEVPGPLPTSGVIHIVIPHADRFTIVGNHLAQHPDLSCTAVGIAVRIQSLPSPPGSNGPPTPTPSAAPSPPTCPSRSGTPPNSSNTG